MSAKPFIRKILSFALILTMVLSLGYSAHAAEGNAYKEITSESGQSTGDCDVYVTRGASFAVKIPTSLTLNSVGNTGTGNYEVFVRGDIDNEHTITIKPKTNNVTFNKISITSNTDSTSRQGTITQEETEIQYNDMTDNYPQAGQLSGIISVSDLTTGTWKGRMVFVIKYISSIPLNGTSEMDKAAMQTVAMKAPIVTFARKTAAPAGTISSVDVSTSKDGSVMAHTLSDGSVVIGADGGVLAPANMSNAFRKFIATNIDCTGLDTKNTTNMTDMFYNCTNLTSLDVSSLNTSNVTKMVSMFSGCTKLTSLDVSNFDTSNVTSMFSMFSDCTKLTSLDVSNFDTSNVTAMNAMFDSCSSLTSLDVSNFDTQNVTSMIGMFRDCSGLTSLDVSNFNTSNVEAMNQMFDGCSSLTTLNINGFDASKIKADYSDSAFRGNDNVTIYVSDVNMETWVKSTTDFPATATVIIGSPS